ncbi:helix-turn-helix transcriptional regulator [Pseudoalteromonas denitrificans]|uniref:Transcriptional regulator, AraC family n=1 Tax=Pseudoalteromonas denitrificans DSM 6059 TaxID=1123010 RepID=A0A1I1Q7C6_9GAMM|nr:AraC family transcriptional regulator [Pseudoalteromonas denitrificans]SFD15113.1 transcriptional regulator, AraC family [Pseudoalteromonas denitrificans DSM 6059]
MSKFIKKPISFELSKKTCVRHKSLTQGLTWAHYQNEHEHLTYENNKQHTLSMYLSGGHGTFRTDINANKGAPGRFCLMPKGCESEWQVGETQQFMHLYFDDTYIKRLALRVFDIDPRTIQLPELTFTQDLGLEALFRHNMATANWHTSDSQLAIEQVTDTILISMLQNMSNTKIKSPLKGGLSPKICDLICDFMHANYQRQIYLSELADLAQLSEFHFCRMFKESMAQTPQEYLTSVRIDHVKYELAHSRLNLADISLKVGFSNQSHMGRYFKKLIGISPREFRKQL